MRVRYAGRRLRRDCTRPAWSLPRPLLLCLQQRLDVFYRLLRADVLDLR